MAWRVDEALIKGELDNRVRGRVTGRLWFAGRDEPVTLDLAGNPWRDLAGHVLRFSNPDPKPPTPGAPDSFASAQRGVVGDITASRKVKVPDCSMDEFDGILGGETALPVALGQQPLFGVARDLQRSRGHRVRDLRAADRL